MNYHSDEQNFRKKAERELKKYDKKNITEEKTKLGLVYGRFQVLHYGHMDYILEILEKCEHLIIGICNPERELTKFNEICPHRSKLSSNPLTYYERMECIKGSLLEAKIDQSRFDIVPFPINFPEKIFNYTPPNAKYFIPIFEPWGAENVRVFKEELGLDVEVIFNGTLKDKRDNATDIRKMIYNNEDWSKNVPNFVYNYIKQHKIDIRIKQLIGDEAVSTKDVMIHGRFQPFTLGHMDQLKKAIMMTEKGQKIYVGITKPFLEIDTGESKGDDHRDNIDANPYSFEERKAMVLKSVELSDDKIIRERLDDIIVIQFPMNNQEELVKTCNKYMKDRNVLQLMNIIPGDEWERKKETILKSLGFQTRNTVDINKPRKTIGGKLVSATRVRNAIKDGGEDWKKLVPTGTAQVVEAIIQNNFSTRDVAQMSLPRNGEMVGLTQQVQKDFESIIHDEKTRG